MALHSHQNHADWIAAARREAARIKPDCGSSAPGSAHLTVSLPQSFALTDFELVRQIHRGGQGVVYEARQKSIPRTVAVKIMRAGPLADDADRLRFEREIGILARLEHRHIVGILERGDAGGCHFLVMDYVAGLPLDRHAREHDLGLRQRLELFALVCDAVAAAHVRGIIHRDLKPSNVLVDAAGEPHILDFGLATMLGPADSPTATATGQFLGSLPWVSPEQAAGRFDAVDVRSDVYSLGVMLYQLITEHMPYSTAGGLEAALARIRTAAPVRPRLLVAAIDDDLETITLKCLQKFPERRYQSTGELAGDLRRYLDRQPIMAKRDSLAYVLRKSLRRHRATALVAAAFAVVVGAGFVTAVVLWQRAAAQRDRAVTAEVAERQQRTRAEEETAKARAVNDFLRDALAAANPDLTPGGEVTVRALLDGAVKQLDAGSLARQPGVESAVRATIGDSYFALGRFSDALAQFAAARALLAELEAESSAEAAALLRRSADAYVQLQRADEAEDMARRALALSRAVHPGDDLAVVAALRTLALASSLHGSRDEGVALRREALAMQERLLGADDPDILNSRLVLAVTEHDASAADSLVKRLSTLFASGAAEPDADLVRILTSTGSMLHIQGDYARAEEAYEGALAAARAVYGPDHPRVIDLLQNLSFLHRSRGDADAGEPQLSEASEVARRTYGANDSRYADLLVQCAALALSRGDLDGGEALVQQVMDMDASGNPPDHWTRAQSESLKGEILARRGQLDAAEPLLLSGYAGIVASQVPGELQAYAARRLAKLYRLKGQADEAAAWNERAEAAGRYPSTP